MVLCWCRKIGFTTLHCLIVARAWTKVGLSDPIVPSGRVIAQQIKINLGITFWSSPRVHIDMKVWHLNVYSLPPWSVANLVFKPGTLSPRETRIFSDESTRMWRVSTDKPPCSDSRLVHVCKSTLWQRSNPPFVTHKVYVQVTLCLPIFLW